MLEAKRAAIYALIQLGDRAVVKALCNYCRNRGWEYSLYIDAYQPEEKYPVRWNELLKDIANGGFFDYLVIYQHIKGIAKYCEKHGTKLIKVEVTDE